VKNETKKGLSKRIFIFVITLAIYITIFTFSILNYEQALTAMPLFAIILFYVFSALCFFYASCGIVFPKQTIKIIYSLGKIANIFNFGFEGIDTRGIDGYGCFYGFSIFFALISCYIITAIPIFF
jgi:hypothetical protein